jgi:hypothetical protein
MVTALVAKTTTPVMTMTMIPSRGPSTPLRKTMAMSIPTRTPMP